jgi:hypothetical protein
MTSLERWFTHVEELIGRGLGARAVYDRLRLDHADCDGTYWSVKRLVRRLRRDRCVRAEDVAIPVETRPGEVAQVDFGEISRLWEHASMKKGVGKKLDPETFNLAGVNRALQKIGNRSGRRSRAGVSRIASLH